MNGCPTPWPSQARPVIVGGVGGSGTRVIALILIELGYYLGAELNAPLDNLWFSFLFKRPGWYRKFRHDQAAMAQGLRIMAAAMRGEPIRSASDRAFVLRAALDHAVALRNPPAAAGLWPWGRVWKLLVSQPKPPPQSKGWGWKEPNCHLYLEQLAENFPTAKFIHTVRHGLDMAFSGNQQQVDHFGWAYGVQSGKTPAEMSRSSLEFWVKANRRAADIGKALGEKRFLLLNFDQLCVEPAAGVRQLLEFLEFDPKSVNVEKLSRIPSVPKSAGRHRQHDLSQFPRELLDDVRSYGFEIGPALAAK